MANAALSGAALGFSFLSGHHQIPIFFSLALGAAWIYYWIRAEIPRRKIAELALLFGVFVVLTSGLQSDCLLPPAVVSFCWAEDPLLVALLTPTVTLVEDIGHPRLASI